MIRLIKPVLKKIYLALRQPLLYMLYAKPSSPMIMSEIKSILVIRLDRIGDLVLSTPLFSQLRKAFPETKIDALVRPYTASIIQHNPDITSVITDQSPENLSRLKGKYDLIIDPYLSYELESALLANKLKARWSVGFNASGRGVLFTHTVPVPPKTEHFVYRTKKILLPLGITPDPAAVPYITVAMEEETAIDKFLTEKNVTKDNEIIMVHPGGFYPSQRWPACRYAALIGALSSEFPNARIFVTGTRLEAETFKTLGAQIADNISTFILIDQPLYMTIALLKRARLFIGNNSGILHVAAALNTPTISTMGPTVPTEWHPFGPPERNIVLNKRLACSPCNRGVCAHHSCMTGISVEEMLNEARKFIKHTS